MEERKPSIFDFDSYPEYFTELVSWKKSVLPSFSFRMMAMKLDSCSHNNLVMISRGTRLPNTELLIALGQYFGLSEEEQAYADALVNFKRAETPGEREFYAEKMVLLKSYRDSPMLAQDTNEFFSQWYHVAILEMVELKEFRADPEWLKHKLFDRITVEQAAHSVDLLQRLEFLRVDPDGSCHRLQPRLRSTQNVSSQVIRQFHIQNLEHAKWCIDNQPMDKRYVTSISCAIDTTRWEEACKLLAEFRSKFIEIFQTKDGDQVCQMAIQMVPLCSAAESKPSATKKSA